MDLVTISFPTTLLMCNEVVFTVGPGGTWAATRIRDSRVNTPSSMIRSLRRTYSYSPTMPLWELLSTMANSSRRRFWGDIFAAEHGSWNKSVRAGYEVIQIPLHQSGNATGEYEDFLTGFVIDNKRVWGRPAGVAIGLDGSLFVTDDASNSIWRVKYVGH
jgi:hypothetical protein